MSTPPSQRREKKTDAPKAAAADGASSVRKPLAERVLVMSDQQLQAYHHSAIRISADAKHPKSAAAKTGLPVIVKEINRRASSDEGPTPAREPVASPKSDIGKPRGG